MAIQKPSRTDRRQRVQSSLQRVLSLSLSDLESATESGSATGDTTEDAASSNKSDDYTGSPKSDDAGDSVDDGARRPPKTASFEGKWELPAGDISYEDRNAVALECIADLDNRLKSVQNTLHEHSKHHKGIDGHLKDLYHRLAVLEATQEKMGKKEEKASTEAIGKTTRRRS